MSAKSCPKEHLCVRNTKGLCSLLCLPSFSSFICGSTVDLFNQIFWPLQKRWGRERKEGPILKVSHQLKPIHHVESIRPIKTCPMSKNVLSISSYLDRWRFLRSYRLEKIHFGKNLKSLSKTGFQTKKQTQKAQKIRSLQLH